MASSISEFSVLSAGDPSSYSTTKAPNGIDWLTSAQLALGDDEMIPLQSSFRFFYALILV